MGDFWNLSDEMSPSFIIPQRASDLEKNGRISEMPKKPLIGWNIDA